LIISLRAFRVSYYGETNYEIEGGKSIKQAEKRDMNKMSITTNK
jgi:hypothetical protein